MDYFKEVTSMKDLNFQRSKLVEDINSQYNKKKKELLAGSAKFKRIPLIRLTTIEVEDKPVMAPFILMSEKSTSVEITFNEDGTVSH